MMEETVQIYWRAPKSISVKLRKLTYNYVYENAPKDSLIYKDSVAFKMIESAARHPDFTLGKIRWELEKQGIFKMIAGLKKIAKSCDLPYTE